MMGDRTAIRMTIIKAIWTLVTSVVRRVMMPLVENLSMLAKENFWTFRYISRRRFRAKPVEALAPKRPGQSAADQRQNSHSHHGEAVGGNMVHAAGLDPLVQQLAGHQGDQHVKRHFADDEDGRQDGGLARTPEYSWPGSFFSS